MPKNKFYDPRRPLETEEERMYKQFHNRVMSQMSDNENHNLQVMLKEGSKESNLGSDRHDSKANKDASNNLHLDYALETMRLKDGRIYYKK